MDPPRAADGGPAPLVLAAFGAMVLFLGLNFIAVRFSNAELPPFFGAALRFGVAALLLLALARARGAGLPRGPLLGWVALFGLTAFGASYGLLYWGMVEVPAGLAALLFSTTPLLTILMAVAARMEGFSWRGLAGAAVVMGGIALAVQAPLQAQVSLLSVAAVLGAAVVAAVSFLAAKRTRGAHPFMVNGIAMGFGTGLLAGASAAAGEAWALPALASTWAAVGWLVLSSAVAFGLMLYVLARWTASATSYSSVLMPLVTIAAASVLAGEAVTPTFLAGGALVLAGVYVGAIHGLRRGPAAGPVSPAATTPAQAAPAAHGPPGRPPTGP